MNPQERELIQSVFDRLAKMAGAPKDPEAEAMIVERLRALPDAPYHLVQAVVVQELTIKQAETHVAELERQLAQARANAAPQAPAAGSFVGAAANPWGRSALPSVPATPPQMAQPQPQYGQPQQQYGQPQQQYQQPQPWGQPSAGGSFLRTAAGAAVGVAGGMMLAQGLSSMFSGSHGAFGGGGLGTHAANPASEAITENTTVNNYYSGNPPPAADQPPPAPYEDNSADYTVGYDGGGGYDDGGSDTF
ncbi:conserved hypothetical protein [Candidatus Terasakiella magnetica]|nr:conserved hypothetical protein [Candidatus Terasakiella magnetica]